jgi:hypothetical protein
MELYVTKKVDSIEDFTFVTTSEARLPLLHLVSPSVEICKEANGRYFVTSQEDLSHFIKLKRLICKNITNKDQEKTKLADDVVWVKPSPMMYYKNENVLVPCNRIILNHPVQLQLSCKSDDIYRLPKPYHIHNMVWTIDYVIVNKDFPWEALNNI